MRIRYERSGGLANIGVKYDVDSAKLSEDKAEQLKRLIEAARPFDQPAASPAPAGAADQYQYELTVEDGGRTHTIRTNDTAASAELMNLFDWLNREALAEQGSKKP